MKGPRAAPVSAARFPLEGASPQPYLLADTQEAEQPAPAPVGTLGASAGASGRLPRPRQVQPSHPRPPAPAARGRTVPRGVEALDLPEWNGASGRSCGPRRRSVSQGRWAQPSGCARGPLHSRLPPRAAFLPGASRVRTSAPSPPPPPGSAALPPASRASRGQLSSTWKIP